MPKAEVKVIEIKLAITRSSYIELDRQGRDRGIDKGRIYRVEPIDGLQAYVSRKNIWAGEIYECHAAGCMVRQADGTGVLRTFEPNMTARYQPQVGDYWIIYEDGYQSIMPKAVFERSCTKA